MAVPRTALLTSTAPHSQALRITRRATPAPQLLSSIFSLNCLALTRTRLILSQRLVSQSTGTKEESVMAPQADSTRYALRTLCASLDAQRAALLHNFRLFQQR